MADALDIGPLLWVKDDINETLDQVLESIDVVRASPIDTSPLRFSQPYLYQASGALDMVGLEGCKFYCNQLEKCVVKLEQKAIDANDIILMPFMDAIHELKAYIQSLLDGADDQPLRLYPALKALMSAMSESLDETALFFPDMSNVVPKSVQSIEFGEQAYAQAIFKQRVIYQKALLAWMQSKSDDAIADMHEALSQVAFAQHNQKVKTLWWVASAFVETLQSAEIAENTVAKKICRKLDQGLRQLMAGESQFNNDLLRDLLYFVAKADVETETIQQVSTVFELTQSFNAHSVQIDPAGITENELQLIRVLKPEIEALHDIWESVSNSIVLEKIDLHSDTAIVALDDVLITQFCNKLNANQTRIDSLSQATFVDLYLALSQASNSLRDNPNNVTQGALIEVATAVNLLDALAQYQHLGTDRLQSLIAETTILNAIATGDYNQQLSTQSSSQINHNNAIKAVVADMQISLKVVEQSLDTFFRNPNDKSTLILTGKPLKKVAAIFDMLNLQNVMQVIKTCDQYIQYFQHDDYHQNQVDFELVAESLSLIGLYTDEMPKVRAATEKSLSDTLARLTDALALANIAFVEEESEAITFQEETSLAVSETHDLARLVEKPPAKDAVKVLDQAFDDELLDIYLTEAEELISLIAQNLQALRVNETATVPLTEVRRNYHTLKGSGRTVGLVGQAEIAAGVENFLNGLLEHDDHPNNLQIKQLEKITAAFADWNAELRATSVLNIDQAYWLNQAHALYQLKTPQTKTADSAEKEAYVLISGKHKISKPLYNIFLNESMQNIGMIEQDVAQLENHTISKPQKRAQHAVHTLASSALASGFKPMGELSRTLELWLDNVSESWNAEFLPLYANVTKAIAKMWQSISNLKMPRAARALIKLLNEAAETSVSEKQVATDLTTLHDAHQESKSVSDVKALNQELFSMFIEEADTILPEIGATLRAWKAAPKEGKHAHLLQRLLHTLKGSARMVGQTDMANMAHELETLVIQEMKHKPIATNFDDMFIALDEMVAFFDQPLPEVSDNVLTPLQLDEVQATKAFSSQAASFFRMREAVLARLMNDAGEVSIIRSRMDREMAGLKAYSIDLTDSVSRMRNYLRELEIEAETQIQSKMNVLQEADEAFDPLEFDRFTRLQELTRMIAESVSDVDAIQHGMLSHLYKTEAALQQQSRMSRDLQQGLLGVRMLPFQHIAERLQRIVRQTARELDKSVDLVIEGELTSVDRGVLEKISAPLEHLLRNAVAHGIEKKPDRLSAGKAETGVIRLQVRTENDGIIIALSDDGQGVDLEAVKMKAIQTGLIPAHAETTEDSLLTVIFEPGFSTANEVTQIAGRGVGLDVVRNDVSGLGGRVDMSNTTGKGASFNIYLPLTQSVAPVLMVRAGNQLYALPVAMITQAQKVKYHDLMAAYEAGKVEWGGVSYTLHYFTRVLQAQDIQIDEQVYASVLLLQSGLNTIALHVDEVIGNQEVVMKDVGSQLVRVPGMVGATVTGDGAIIFIVNPVIIANRSSLAMGGVTVKSIRPNVSQKARVLVVDDSLTMRKVLGRLLEREGYEVKVAKDGMEAMDMLQVSTPDVILTDIEMPRLDGFGLSRNIRDDARTANTPLIMISSRTAGKHQSLAKEVGVDAFFGKPVDDKSLLEKVKELIAR